MASLLQLLQAVVAARSPRPGRCPDQEPRGRPKKRESLTSLLKEEIAKICQADREKRTWMELVVRATLQLAMNGNATALKEGWERLDGKVLQTEKVQLSGNEEREVQIRVVYEEGPGNHGSPTTKPRQP